MLVGGQSLCGDDWALSGALIELECHQQDGGEEEPDTGSAVQEEYLHLSRCNSLVVYPPEDF